MFVTKHDGTGIVRQFWRRAGSGSKGPTKHLAGPWEILSRRSDRGGASSNGYQHQLETVAESTEARTQTLWNIGTILDETLIQSICIIAILLRLTSASL